MKNLIKAVIAVMNDVKGIEKSMTVGNGNSSYKGVPDKEVKRIIGQSMAKNGLCILPTGIKPSIKIERWEEPDYSGKIKTKQTVFTEVTATYLLMHESGECQEISGYGHGVDAQDKGAGKASTYALKYALLYSFLVPTGDIDDTDSTHSQEHSVKSKQGPTKTPPLAKWESTINSLTTVDQLVGFYSEHEYQISQSPEIMKLLSNRKAQLNK